MKIMLAADEEGDEGKKRDCIIRAKLKMKEVGRKNRKKKTRQKIYQEDESRR